MQLSAGNNLDSLLWTVTGVLFDVLDQVDNLVAFDNLAKDNVAAIEPCGGNGGDEELGAVGVFAAVGHAEKALARVLELEVLIRELVAIDGLAASSYPC
jgi:hypothetical protein